jgi:putative transposase
VYPTVRLALVRATRRAPARFRIVQYSVQRDHVHLIVEAADTRSLSSGVRSVAIRIARYVNDLLARRGRLWADRWHGRALRSPREVHHAMLYVLANFRKHAGRAMRAGVDPYSSGVWFDGWREWRLDSGVPPPLAEAAGWFMAESGELRECGMASWFAPQTWLARIGWKRRGLLGIGDAPAR